MAVVLLCAFWGMAVMAFNVTFQSEIITYAPAAASSVAMAIYSGIYNLGIGSGTWIGGSICTPSVHFLYRNCWWHDSSSGGIVMHICCDKVYEGI